MKLTINDLNGNQHTIYLYAEDDKVMVSGWNTFGGYDTDYRNGIKPATARLKHNHEEDEVDEWVWDIISEDREHVRGLLVDMAGAGDTGVDACKLLKTVSVTVDDRISVLEYEHQCYKCNQLFKTSEIIDTVSVATGEDTAEEVVFCPKCNKPVPVEPEPVKAHPEHTGIISQLKENNKLIAIFMGLNPCDDREEYHSTLYTNVTDDLTYHKSWDSLMPVVEEIEMRHQGVPQQLLYLSLFSTIEEVHQAVVEFIKLDNKENK